MTSIAYRSRRAVAAPLSAALLVAVALVPTAPLAAHAFSAGDLELEHPSAPPTPPGASSAAGYLVVVNTGPEDDRLIGGSAPFASGIELHRTTLEDDVARMRRLDDGIVIPAGATVRLDPGGTHLMFTGLSEPLPDGETRPVTLRFERAGAVEVEFAIERPGNAPAGTMDHDDMDHGEMDHDAPTDESMKSGETGHGMSTDDAVGDEEPEHDSVDHESGS